MHTEIINEPVDVAAVFGRTAIKPKWFVWHNRKFTITEITYVWHDKQGEARIVYFAVTDGATVFELSLNQKTLSWMLEKTTIV